MLTWNPILLSLGVAELLSSALLPSNTSISHPVTGSALLTTNFSTLFPTLSRALFPLQSSEFLVSSSSLLPQILSLNLLQSNQFQNSKTSSNQTSVLPLDYSSFASLTHLYVATGLQFFWRYGWGLKFPPPVLWSRTGTLTRDSLLLLQTL